MRTASSAILRLASPTLSAFVLKVCRNRSSCRGSSVAEPSPFKLSDCGHSDNVWARPPRADGRLLEASRIGSGRLTSFRRSLPLAIVPESHPDTIELWTSWRPSVRNCHASSGFPHSYLVQGLQQVGWILVTSICAGTLKFILAIASRKENYSQGIRTKRS